MITLHKEFLSTGHWLSLTDIGDGRFEVRHSGPSDNWSEMHLSLDAAECAFANTLSADVCDLG